LKWPPPLLCKGVLRRIRILFAGVVHGDHEAVGIGKLGGDGAAQIGGKSSDAALARQVIAEERDLTNLSGDVGVSHYSSPFTEATRSDSSPDHLYSEPKRDEDQR
jgi:hypothetical protein